MTGKTVTLKLDSGSLTAGGTTGQGVIDADSLTLSAADTTINLSNQGVLDLLAANRDSTDGVGLVLTTEPSLWTTSSKSDSLLSWPSLGYTVTEVLGADGTLMVSGNTDLVYLVDTTPNSDDPNISDYAALDPYKAVGINGHHASCEPERGSGSLPERGRPESQQPGWQRWCAGRDEYGG